MPVKRCQIIRDDDGTPCGRKAKEYNGVPMCEEHAYEVIWLASQMSRERALGIEVTGGP